MISLSMTTIIPTDNDCQISGRLVDIHLPNESDPRYSIVLAEVSWDLSNSEYCNGAILRFQCHLRSEDSLSELPFQTLEGFKDNILKLRYSGNHQISGSQVEIDAMSIALLS